MPTPRRTCTRNDLPELKALDAAGVFQVLGTFDDRGLDDDAFALAMIDLLDADRIPALRQAKKGAMPDAVRKFVFARMRDVVAHARTTKEAKDTSLTAAAAKPDSAGDQSPDAATVRQTRIASQIRQADEVCTHRFTFYEETHQLPDDIDWNFNPGTAHWSMDLNRFSYLNPLTQAGIQTGESRYARKAVELVLDWINKCQLQECFTATPYAWGSYLNNAIHCEVWASQLHHWLRQDVVTPAELLRIVKSLHDQLAYLEIVTANHHGNWPTIGCRGMLATLAHVPLLRDHDRFVSYCTDSLENQLDEQRLPDGVQDELTPHYHWVVIKNMLVVAESLTMLGQRLSPTLRESMRSMVHYAQQTITPGRTARVNFNDSDWTNPPDIAASLKPAGLEDLATPADELGPEAFPYAGVGLLRQKVTDGDLYLAFDGGPFGRAHQHEDMLGFWLHAFGRDFIVDPGRHLYDHSEKSFIDHLRSTQAHSTITVDNQPQNSQAKRDTWIAKKPGSLTWQVNETSIRAAAKYDLGYGPDNDIDVVHTREIVFVEDRFWVVFDHVAGEGVHTIHSRFQFAPHANPVLDGPWARTSFHDANLTLGSFSSHPWSQRRIVEGQTDPRAGWVSPSYGLIQPAPLLELESEAALPLKAATLLLPWRGDVPPNLTAEFEDFTLNVTIAGEAARVITASI